MSGNFRSFELLQRKESFLFHFDPKHAGNPHSNEARYSKQLAPHRESLINAKAVLLVGHPHNDDEKAHAIAANRIKRVETLVHTMARGKDKRLWHVTLPRKLTINTTRVASYLKQRGRQHLRTFPPVTWDAPTTLRILGLLNPSQNLQTLPQDHSNWLGEVFRHSVIVVPLYCDGTEFDPTSWSKDDRADF